MRAHRLVLGLALALWAGAAGLDGLRTWVAATVLPPLSLPVSAEVLARDGRLLRAYPVADGRWRMPVDPAAVDPTFLAMLMAFEDRRFRQHPGVDARAIARALWQSARAGRVVSGGSTLTMQVARLLEDSGTGRLAGKLRQARVALALERRIDKDQVLGLYLLLAPYGGNLEGVRAASLAYFGKEPRRLTPAEAALLVALPQSPEARRPDRHPAAARAARDRVLGRAAAAGILTAEEAAAAMAEPVPLARRPVPRLAPHLADRLHLSAAGADPAAPPIRTTIDATLQAAFEDLAAEAVADAGPRMQAALIAVDHASGEVLATVGSSDYTDDPRQGFVDMVTAPRSPGSLLKPLIFALAFDEGLAHPETLLDDRPTDFAGYAPQNFDRLFRGEIRAREALQLSLNVPAVALTEALGPAKLMAALRRAGADPRLPGRDPGLAVALGGVGLSLREMAGVFAALARGGVAVPLRETGEGAAGERLVSAVAAWQVGDILAGLPPPPGAPANRLAYKTGTSYGHRDAWAVGWDGRHVVAVWMGRADGTAIPGIFGADLAAPVLFRAFQRLKPRLDPLPPPPPATLTVSTAQLPLPLQRFRPRSAAFAPAADAPAVDFPKDGTEVERMAEGLLLRVRGGSAPFTWLVDGAPVVIATREAATLIPTPAAGFVTLSVIDADGRSARARVRLR